MIVDDVIAVRFMSKPYREIQNLRIGSRFIEPWLAGKQIEYCKNGRDLLFTLPDKYLVISTLDEAVVNALKPIRDIFRSEMIKLDTHFSSQIAKYSVPLTSSEQMALYNLVGQKLSILKFSR